MIEIKGTHPFAEHFQMFSDEELDLLADDIRENGLMEPITITPDGLILDGRNRFEACRRAEVEPETEVYEGDSFGQFVRSRNVRRRHSTPGQLAMSTALTMAAEGLRVNGRWKRGSVDIGQSPNTEVSTWQDYMKKAGLVLDVAVRADALGPDYKAFIEQPDLVKSGKLALDAAYRTAQNFETKAAMAEMALYAPLDQAMMLTGQIIREAIEAADFPVIEAPLKKGHHDTAKEMLKDLAELTARIRTYFKENA